MTHQEHQATCVAHVTKPGTQNRTHTHIVDINVINVMSSHLLALAFHSLVGNISTTTISPSTALFLSPLPCISMSVSPLPLDELSCVLPLDTKAYQNKKNNNKIIDDR